MANPPFALPLGHSPVSSPFEPQFRGVGLDIRSIAVTPIEFFDLFDNLIPGMHATGFFYRGSDGRLWLCTARHVIAGLDCFTNQPMSPSAFLPVVIRVHPFRRVGEQTRIAVDVQVRDGAGTPLWLEDPLFNSLRTDIACICLEDLPAGQFAVVNEAPDDPLMANVGVDCFVVGYPISSYASPYLPVWRRGSLAYEPSEPINGKPLFLVDAATSKGMSGSPIFQRWHGPAPLLDHYGNIGVSANAVVSTRLIGVYGGRIEHVGAAGPVGYGWYANRIQAMLPA